jgi:hypothetical protein
VSATAVADWACEPADHDNVIVATTAQHSLVRRGRV